MSKPYPALCRDCQHSEPERNADWCLRCTHPTVNASDPWALSSNRALRGTGCREERERRWFAPCGRSGKLWEAKR